MGNSMAALFLCPVALDALERQGLTKDKSGLPRDEPAEGQMARRVDRRGVKKWARGVRISSACFLQSPLCRYFGKESAP